MFTRPATSLQKISQAAVGSIRPGSSIKRVHLYFLTTEQTLMKLTLHHQIDVNGKAIYRVDPTPPVSGGTIRRMKMPRCPAFAVFIFSYPLSNYLTCFAFSEQLLKCSLETTELTADNLNI